jgi:hypothetical protein
MENPYVREGLKGGRTLAQSPSLGNAKLWQNDEFPDSLALPVCTATAVDKALGGPYLCGVGSAAEALILSIVFGR